ncbi:MAG: nucleotide exchange factor GrpE [Clostridia bacterium]|nr:nucleotide exchange factor GrpE [Clostridia bacterium]
MAEKKKKAKATEEEAATVSVAEFEEVKAELDKNRDLLLRTAAEFDNFKKRTERERASVAEYAKASVIKQLLPVFDNVDRAESCDKDSADYAKGIELIVKQLNEVVTNLGITETGAVGDAFDPTVHEAVMHIEDDSVGENVIVEVFQKGYRIGDTVIRAAMVKVAN